MQGRRSRRSGGKTREESLGKINTHLVPFSESFQPFSHGFPLFSTTSSVVIFVVFYRTWLWREIKSGTTFRVRLGGENSVELLFAENEGEKKWWCWWLRKFCEINNKTQQQNQILPVFKDVLNDTISSRLQLISFFPQSYTAPSCTLPTTRRGNSITQEFIPNK